MKAYYNQATHGKMFALGELKGGPENVKTNIKRTLRHRRCKRTMDILIPYIFGVVMCARNACIADLLVKNLMMKSL